jgi:SHO1 osmosensor
VISDVKETYPNFAWWGLVYTFFCIIGVLVTVASDAEQTYNVAVGTGFVLRSQT